jgi:hypothetical protein
MDALPPTAQRTPANDHNHPPATAAAPDHDHVASAAPVPALPPLPVVTEPAAADAPPEVSSSAPLLGDQDLPVQRVVDQATASQPTGSTPAGARTNDATPQPAAPTTVQRSDGLPLVPTSRPESAPESPPESPAVSPAETSRALPVLQPILADRQPVVPDRSAIPPTERATTESSADTPTHSVRTIDRPPGRLPQLAPTVQRAAATHQAPLAMPTAPVPAINPISTAPTPQHRTTTTTTTATTRLGPTFQHGSTTDLATTQRLATSPTTFVTPATPVVVQRTATVPTAPDATHQPEQQGPDTDGTVVQLAEAPAPQAPSTPTPGSTPTSTTDIDGLARRLYDPIARRLRAELRVDRERAGTLVDRPW